MYDRPAVLRPRRWPLLILPMLVIALAAGWSAFWFYASAGIRQQFEGWAAREAKSGRAFECGQLGVGGYPFRLELQCDAASVALTAQAPDQPLGTATLARILAVAQVYQPNLAIAEFTGPLTIADRGQAPSLVLNWNGAQASLYGIPDIPQRASLAIDEPRLDRAAGSVQTPLMQARRIELHGRVAGGTVASDPVIDVAIQIAQGRAEGMHPLAATAFDLAAQARLRGLKDLTPKPWPARFREIQAAGGRVEIVQARVQQGDMVAVSTGMLGIGRTGYLEGELRMVVAGVERLIPALGLDKMIAEAAPAPAPAQAPKSRGLTEAMGALDRVAPGLGNIVRQQAPTVAAAGLAMIGEKTTLEGRSAQAFPLRFVEGVMYLGPVRVAQTPPLF